MAEERACRYEALENGLRGCSLFEDRFFVEKGARWGKAGGRRG